MTSPVLQKVLELAKMDKLVLLVQLILLAIGVIFIYGAGVEIGGAFATKWIQQLGWIGIGGIAYCACALIDYHRLGKYSWIFYVAALLLLALVLVAGIRINGAKSWIRVCGFMLQPSELCKPATLLFMCWAVTHRAWDKSPIPPWLLETLIILPPFCLVMLQPDFGTGLVFFPFCFAVAFVKGLRWKWIIIAVVTVTFMAPFLFQLMKPHQKERVKVFLESPSHAILAILAPILPDDTMDSIRKSQDEFFALEKTNDGKAKPRDNWNAQQSLLAVGSGGFAGKGFLKGTQHVLGYLPKNVAPTDFIFSVIAEETGFLGSAFLIVCFISITLCGYRTAFLASDAFGLCLALGVTVIFATHAFINIGMTVQAAPIIGIPLPFVSYGGSFMISTMILAGLAQSVHIHRKNTD